MSIAISKSAVPSPVPQTGKNILVSGSLAYDRIMNFPGNFKDHIMPDKIHILNLSFQVETVEEEFGGTAGNIAYSLKLLGAEPKIISAAGNDFDAYKKHLLSNGIDISYINIVPDKKTAFVSVITDLDDNQIGAFYAGALDYAVVSRDLPQGVGLAVITAESKDAMIKRVELYEELKLPFIFDPAQQIIKFSGAELVSCIQGAKMLIGNDYEFALILRKSALSLSDILGMVEILVVTYGERGSRIYTRDGQVKIEAVKPVKVVDPTGAGDAYRAGFAAGLVEGMSLTDCGELGSWVAAKAVECYGAQKHQFKREDYFNPAPASASQPAADETLS